MMERHPMTQTIDPEVYSIIDLVAYQAMLTILQAEASK